MLAMEMDNGCAQFQGCACSTSESCRPESCAQQYAASKGVHHPRVAQQWLGGVCEIQQGETQMPTLRMPTDAVQNGATTTCAQFQYKYVEGAIELRDQPRSGNPPPFYYPEATHPKTRQTTFARDVNVREVPCGLKNTKGRRPRMEDRDSVVPNFVSLPMQYIKGDSKIPQALLWKLGGLKTRPEGGSPRSPLTRVNSNSGDDAYVLQQKLGNLAGRNVGGDGFQSIDAFTLGAVFDGHGGDGVASKLSERFPELLKEVLSGKQRGGSDPPPTRDDDLMQDVEMDDMALSKGKLMILGNQVVDAEGLKGGEWKYEAVGQTEEARGNLVDKTFTLQALEEGLKEAFQAMDAELGDVARTVGSTGVVSLVSANHLVVANVGDSRAVLSRNGEALRLSRDHKPDDDEEEERIRRGGGRVWEYNGMRVMGLLAMTRAFGDHCLQPYGLTAEPEITIIQSSPEDEFLILASDGLWDVISDEEACELARRCFQRASERNAARDTAARVAASVLMRAALDKGSNDNITVLVMDLRP